LDRVIRIGMLGCGTVGSGVATILHDEADDIGARTGAKLELARIAVRDVRRERGLPLPPQVDRFVRLPGSSIRFPRAFRASSHGDPSRFGWTGAGWRASTSWTF
jgi:hypothetical protein